MLNLPPSLPPPFHPLSIPPSLPPSFLQYDDDAELYQIPPLGQHFSRKWAVEDLKEEREEAAKLAMMAEPGNRAMENGGWQEESGMSE